MTNKEFKGFVRLSSDQYAELKLNGSLVIEGRIIEYSPLDTIYMITDAGNMIDVANTTEGEPNDVVLNITNNILRAQLNQTIKTKINNKQDKLTFDTTPTINSNNPVTSNGVYDALALKQDKLTAGTNITIDENNVISASGGASKLYAHFIYQSISKVCIVIYTTASDLITGAKLIEILTDLGCTDNHHIYPCAETNAPQSSSSMNVANGIFVSNGVITIRKTQITAKSQENSSVILFTRSTGTTGFGSAFTDTVTEL